MKQKTSLFKNSELENLRKNSSSLKNRKPFSIDFTQVQNDDDTES